MYQIFLGYSICVTNLNNFFKSTFLENRVWNYGLIRYRARYLIRLEYYTHSYSLTVKDYLNCLSKRVLGVNVHLMVSGLRGAFRWHHISLVYTKCHDFQITVFLSKVTLPIRLIISCFPLKIICIRISRANCWRDKYNPEENKYFKSWNCYSFVTKLDL